MTSMTAQDDGVVYFNRSSCYSTLCVRNALGSQPKTRYLFVRVIVYIQSTDLYEMTIHPSQVM